MESKDRQDLISGLVAGVLGVLGLQTVVWVLAGPTVALCSIFSLGSLLLALVSWQSLIEEKVKA